MNYEYAFPYVEDVTLIFELGARDCKDSVTLQRRFGCPVVAFECNPDGIKQCRETLAAAPELPITLVEKAVHIYDGETSFFPFDPTKYDNIGASSLFHHKELSDVQKTVTVPCTRLDSFIGGAAVPDLLCMDIQGGELNALKSLGPLIDRVKYVATECAIEGFYADSYTFKEIYEFMWDKGFELVYSPYGNGEMLEFRNGIYNGQKETDVVWGRV